MRVRGIAKKSRRRVKSIPRIYYDGLQCFFFGEQGLVMSAKKDGAFRGYIRLNCGFSRWGMSEKVQNVSKLAKKVHKWVQYIQFKMLYNNQKMRKNKNLPLPATLLFLHGPFDRNLISCLEMTFQA